ncbi:MAG TPA: DUF2723 domain-containing protein [Gemmatimonadaceae bacterium]|nr:DUF2723 domain-containing protein [Gemmatimonadaceae bacterium]
MTSRHRYFIAAGTTLGIFLLYLATLSPSVAMWDAGEYIASASSLGIPHQPGNPLFVLIAHVAGLIPVSPSYAVRINLLAAMASAVSAGLWFLCAERLMRTLIASDRLRSFAAVTAALLGATAFTVWNQSVVMEKVYPLALVGLALVSWIMIVWLDTPAPNRGDRLLVLVGYIMGLTYAIHPAGLLTGPACVLAVLRHRPAMFRRWGLMAVVGAAFLAGASPFAMMPIRAAHQPFINQSAVSACEDGSIAASCTFSAETFRRLKGTIEREQYGGNAVLERRGPFAAQLEMYWMYFKWQWVRDVGQHAAFVQSIAAAVMLVLGIFGLAALRSRGDSPAQEKMARPAYVWYFGALAVTFTIALIVYLNFRYGWSQRPDLGNTVDREPRDRDYFFMWTFSLWGLLAGLGIASLTRAMRGKAAIVMAAAVMVPLVANWSPASRTGQHFTSEWAKDILTSLEPNAVIITNGDNDSFPLWYAQEVEGIRRDVIVTLTPYLDMPWYARQLNQRHGLWNLSNQDLDTIPPAIQMRTASSFEHGTISASVPPGVYTRAQLLVLQAIKDSFPTRPIYFSVGSYGRSLGLDPYLKRVGLVDKLEPQRVQEGPDTARLANGFIDIPRSLELWKRFGGTRQVIREGRWIDEGSSMIPLYYAWVGQELAVALDARGRTVEANEVMDLARQVVAVVEE